MTGAAEATIRATASMIFFIGGLLRLGRLISGSTGLAKFQVRTGDNWTQGVRFPNSVWLWSWCFGSQSGGEADWPVRIKPQSLVGRRDRRDEGVVKVLISLRERAENVYDRHAMAKIGVDETGLDATVLTHDERRWDRQEPPVVPLKPLEIDAELPVGLLDLVADPEHQAEREGISQIKVS